MDPDRVLEDIREICDILDDEDPTKDLQYFQDQLVEKFRILDNWLKNGGFRPDDWSHDEYEYQR